MINALHALADILTPNASTNGTPKPAIAATAEPTNGHPPNGGERA
jgi:hypothetical protein